MSGEREALLWAIQRLDQNPNELTKRQCIEVLADLWRRCPSPPGERPVIPEGWNPAPASDLRYLLSLIDPRPVTLPNSDKMLLKKPNAAAVLARISAEIHNMLAGPLPDIGKAISQSEQPTQALVDADRDFLAALNAELLAALKYATEELNELKMGTRYRAQTGYVIMRCEAAIAQAERANT